MNLNSSLFQHPMKQRKKKLLAAIAEGPYRVHNITPPLRELVRDRLVTVVRGTKWSSKLENYEPTNHRNWAKITDLGERVNVGVDPWPARGRRVERRIFNGRGK